MAKENIVLMEGYIEERPVIKVDKEGTARVGEFKLTTLKRMQSIGTKVLPMEFSCPRVRTENPDKIKAVSKIKVGDYVRVKGTLSTKPVNKSKKCPDCGTVNSVSGILTYVNLIFIDIVERDIFEIDEDGNFNKKNALEKLKSRSEVSNMFTCIGAVVRDVDTYSDPERPNIHATKYQLAVNRKYLIKEDGPDAKTDYPYIISYGKQALQDAEQLQEGSVVYVNGFIRSKRVKRKFTCCNCGCEYDWIDPVIDVVPFGGVEFLFKNKDDIVDVQDYAEDKLSRYIAEYAKG